MKKMVIISIIAIILLLGAYWGYIYYLKSKISKNEEKLKQEAVEELTEEEFLNSLANPEYKEKEITSNDINSLNSLRSPEKKTLSADEKAKELELLESLSAPAN